jgi:hypothetical protein
VLNINGKYVENKFLLKEGHLKKNWIKDAENIHQSTSNFGTILGV